jgi:hypothetical protein
MEYNFKMHFYLKTDKLNVKGNAPVYLRLTLNGQRAEISINQSILPINWNKHAERAKGNREEVRIFNGYLDSLAIKVKQCFTDLLNINEYFDINDLKNHLNGKGKMRKTLIQVYEENNQIMKLEVGSKFIQRTVDSYSNSLARLKRFVKAEYEAEDIPLGKLNFQFIQRYAIYLSTTYSNRHNTIMRYIKQLKRVIHQAMAYGYIDKDPFTEFKTTYQDPNRAFLTEEELMAIENKEIRIERLRIVRDIFLFMCYTGLSY